MVLINPLFDIMILSIVISLVFAVLSKLLVNQNKLKELKAEIENVKKGMEKARKEKNEKELKALMERSLKASNQQMMMNMKPMMVSILIVAIVLPILAKLYSGAIFQLPFWLPEKILFIPFFGADVSWLGLYIIISLPATFIFRKLLGVE